MTRASGIVVRPVRSHIVSERSGVSGRHANRDKIRTDHMAALSLLLLPPRVHADEVVLLLSTCDC